MEFVFHRTGVAGHLASFLTELGHFYWIVDVNLFNVSFFSDFDFTVGVDIHLGLGFSLFVVSEGYREIDSFNKSKLLSIEVPTYF